MTNVMPCCLLPRSGAKNRVRGPRTRVRNDQETPRTARNIAKRLEKPPERTALDPRHEEMKLAHEVAESSGDEFRLVLSAPLVVELSRWPRTINLFLWEYLGELPPGPSELRILIPTANMKLDPQRLLKQPPPEQRARPD